MCLGIPGKIVWIKEDKAGVDMGDVVFEASTQVVDGLEIGDYVLVHSGYVLEKLDTEDALKTLALFKELYQQELQ
jgi:hydrogenase expression/formation protein HypC